MRHHFFEYIESRSMSHVADPASALDGLVILDFSRVLSGPLATMTLADLGATVIKVERPDTGDDTRGWGPPHDARGVATYFLSVNRNKHSVVLDLASPKGRAFARRLADRADVIVENFRPGVIERLGLGYDQLAAERPELIYASISGFGREGGAALPGYDLLVQAVGGLMSITGEPDGAPQKVGVALVDVVTGLHTAIGILAALRHRDRTGEGQRVDVDLLTALLAGLVNQSSSVAAGGASPARMGNAHPSIAPYELLPTADGDLVLAVGNDRQFAALCTQLGRPELADDSRFVTNALRVANRAALRGDLIDALAAASAAHWTDRLLASGVPAGEVRDVAGAIALAERLGLRPLVGAEDEAGDPVPTVRNPLRLSRTPARYRTAPPALGATSAEAALALVGSETRRTRPGSAEA
jgi:crotonobetainyl-CoA:carnitine CoA-transferase CaiB-like acyl-CoA transferase